MGLIARIFGLGKTYEELSPMEKEWVDNCGFQFYSTGGTVYYDNKALEECKRWSEVNAMQMEAIQKGYGLPPLDPTVSEMKAWMSEQELRMENEKLKERIRQYEDQGRPAIRNSRNRPTKSRVVRGKSRVRHRNNG